MAGTILAWERQKLARDGMVEVRGEVDGLRDGSSLKNGGGTAGATSGGEMQRAAALLRLPASRGRGKGEEGEAKWGFARDVAAPLKR